MQAKLRPTFYSLLAHLCCFKWVWTNRSNSKYFKTWASPF